MKKILSLITCIVCCANISFSQAKRSNTTDTVVAEYIPVEGRSQTGVPQDLQGTWILLSGVKKSTSNSNALHKKTSGGTEVRRDSITTTTTIDGETHTTSEINIERNAATERKITPVQKEKLHVAEKPSISFYGLNETFSGFTGCNKYAGRYKIAGNKITLSGAAAATKMACLGEYDEQDFLSTLKRVNSFKANNGNLELMAGSEVLLVFKRQ